MAILYYNAQYRVGLASDPLDLSREPELETVPGMVELEERSTYFLRAFDEQGQAFTWLEQVPFVEKTYPGGLKEISLLNRVGLTRIGPIAICVKSGKLSEERYRCLIDYVADRFANLIFSFNQPTGENTKKGASGSDLPYVEFLFLDRFLLGSPERIEVIAGLILSDPHRILAYTPVSRSPEAVEFVDCRVIENILLSPQTLAPLATSSPLKDTTLSGRLYAQKGKYLFPARIRTVKKEHSFDTNENRFIKFFLGQLAKKIETLEKAMAGKRGGYLNPEIEKKLHILRRSLAIFTAAPLWKDVGTMHQVPANSQVLQKKDGYRQLFRLYGLLQLVTACDFSSRDFENILETKDIATLYEYWCFFVLKEILDDMGTPLGWRQTVRSDPLQQKLISGYELEYANGMVFSYNCLHKAGVESYSHDMRPDFTLTFKNESIVFDAKFKGTVDGGEIQSSNQDDIDKMHTYRDSLLGVRGAFVLYPGKNESPELYRAHGGTRVYDGVGAFPLLPDEGGRPREQQLQHLEKLIMEFLST